MIHNTMPVLKCSECGSIYPLNEMVYRCEKCDFPLEVIYDSGAVLNRRFVNLKEHTMWRYASMLPIAKANKVVSMKEGNTPLHRSVRLAQMLGTRNLYLKDETRNPTGSFKDRGSSVGVSKALELGADVGCVSHGNMAASLAAYAARVGINCAIMLKTDTPLAKITPILVHGAQVIAVARPYSEIYKMGIELSKQHNFYWVHSDSSMRVEGQKTCSYEIAEQMKWKVPDRVIVPTSSGGNVSAQWKAWKELRQLGIIDKMPSMVVIQPEGACPIVKAFESGKDNTEPFAEAYTIAHSISNADPPSGRRVLKLLRESNGMAESVSDKEMLEAQKTLAQTEGIFAETSSAASIAGLKKLIRKKLIDPEETVVCIITGTGLKDIDSAKKLTGKVIRLDSWNECSRVLKEMKSGNKK